MTILSSVGFTNVGPNFIADMVFLTDNGVKALQSGNIVEIEVGEVELRTQEDIEYISALLKAKRIARLFLTCKEGFIADFTKFKPTNSVGLQFHHSIGQKENTDRLKYVRVISFTNMQLTSILKTRDFPRTDLAPFQLVSLNDKEYNDAFGGLISQCQTSLRNLQIRQKQMSTTISPAQPLPSKVQQLPSSPAPKGPKEAKVEGPNSNITNKTVDATRANYLARPVNPSEQVDGPGSGKATPVASSAPFTAHAPASDRSGLLIGSDRASGSGRSSNIGTNYDKMPIPKVSALGPSSIPAASAQHQVMPAGNGAIALNDPRLAAKVDQKIGQTNGVNNLPAPPNRLPPPVPAHKNVFVPQVSVRKGPSSYFKLCSAKYKECDQVHDQISAILDKLMALGDEGKDSPSLRAELALKKEQLAILEKELEAIKSTKV